MVNVVAVNGSPRMDNGYTARVLSPFLDGMRDAGASVELFYVWKMNFEPCPGELYCWDEKPGICFKHDSMEEVYPKLRAADILVLATPVFIPLPAEMQNFLNRLCPLIDPVLSWRDGRTRAKLHDDVKIRKIVLVSVCGWWELGNFDVVVHIVEELAKNASVEFAEPILRPHAAQLSKDSEKSRMVLDALATAGYELVKNGAVSQCVLETISQPLISEEEYRKRNQMDAQEKVRS